MSTIEKKSNGLGFEVFESDENSVVFKRVIPSKGRKPKEKEAIELNLPKATMHLFNQEDISRLKVIEQELTKHLQVAQPGRSWYEILNRIFDIK
ncbi:MAG: hypothetical protein K2Q21_12320 [Chitinophagaceae bacterium]|nr:hypothetical protein [Chitinophagaceae bacterium]